MPSPSARKLSNSDAGETTKVVLSPYAETPDFFRTTVEVEGAKRWFEKSRVSIVSRDENKIILSMPKTYAEKRAGIAALILDDRNADGLNTAVPSQVSSGGQVESSVDRETSLPERLDLQVGPGGRIVIPAVFRDAMQIKEGDRLMARVVDGEVRLISPRMAVRRAQKIVQELIPGDDSLVDELIAERRREAEREMEDG